MKFLTSNKKGAGGVGYLLIAIAMLITFLLLQFLTSANKVEYFDIENDILKTQDLANTKLTQEEVYTNQLFRSFFFNAKKNYIRYEVDSKFFSGNFDKNNDLTCYADEIDRIIFYNEYFLNEQNNSCMLEKEDFYVSFNDYTKTKLRSYLNSYFSKLRTSSIESFDSIISETGLISLSLNTKYLDSIEGLATIESKSSYNYEYDLEDFPMLIKTLEESFKNYSNYISRDILSCKTQLTEEEAETDIIYDDKELECLNLIYSQLISELDSEIASNYDFNITRVFDSGSDYIGGYYALNFDIYKKGSGDSEFKFMAIFEHNIPFGLVDYSLKLGQELDNMVLVNIEDSIISSEVAYYVILYSQDNFLDKNSYGASRYDELLDLLANGRMPDEFISLGKDSDSDNIGTLYRSDGSDLNLNLLLVDANDLASKKLPAIYQIFNFETNEYELLQPNRPLYFSVFAVDNTFTYYTDESLLKKNLKSIAPETIFGPEPLKSPQISVSGLVENSHRSFTFSVKNHEDPQTSYYDFFVTAPSDNIFSIEKYCDDDSVNCYKNRIPYNPSLNSKYLVTSDPETSATGISQTFEIGDDSVFQLENGQDYRLYVVSVNSQNKGTYSSVVQTKSVNENYDGEVKYYSISNLLTPPYDIKQSSRLFTIEDDKPTTLSDISSLALSDSGNNLYLQWAKVDPGVDYLFVYGTKYDAFGGFETFVDKRVEFNNNLLDETTGYIKYEINKVIPWDDESSMAFDTLDQTQFILSSPLVWER